MAGRRNDRDVGEVGARGACYRVSVVTAVLDGAETLSGTIESVAAQDYPHVEHIVIDGGSTDGTVDLLAHYADSIDYWVSEPDSGIAEAMNKGIARARGDLVLFLHADDHFTDPQALSRAMKSVCDLGHIWAFDVLFGYGAEQRRLYSRPFNTWAWFRNPLPHQGVLCPRHLFERLGSFDPRWRICMDYEFWLRAMAAGVPLERVDQLLAVMGRGGVSSRLDRQGLKARFEEERAIQLVHARGWRWHLIYALFWPLYLGYRSLRSVTGWSAS